VIGFVVIALPTGFGLVKLLRDEQARVRSQRVAAWKTVAKAVGLHIVETDGDGAAFASLVCKDGPRLVRIADCADRRNKELGIRITIDCGVPVTIRPETPSTALAKILEQEPLVGDPAFDRLAYLNGQPDLLQAILDSETRLVVSRLLRGMAGETWMDPIAPIVVRDGALTAFFRHDDPEMLVLKLPAVLGALVNSARQLTHPGDIAGRIAANLRREPEATARLRDIEILLGAHRKHSATHAALREACNDADENVKLAAALGLGREGRPTLIEIARAESTSDPVAARAIAALRKHLGKESTLAILGRSLRRRQLRSAHACVTALGQLGGSDVVEPLAKVLAVEAGELAVAAATALGSCGGSGAEGTLLAALQREELDVRLAAVKALGQMGSAAAVPALKDAGERGPGEFFGSELQRTVRQAIAEIQSRLSGASPGQLSVAEGSAGELSLADEDLRGRVSLPERGSSRCGEGE
jgi:hypothetical protein